MYSVLLILFLIGILSVVAGFIGRVGTDGISDVSENVAASLSMLIIFSFVILGMGTSPSGLMSAFEGICGGVPYVRDIADYGSLHKVISDAPLSAATSFMDTVVLSAINQIGAMIFLPTSKEARKRFMANRLMTYIFTGFVIAIASLLLLNYVIKGSVVYQFIVSAIGVCISLFSICTGPMSIILMLKNDNVVKAGIVASIFLFSKSKISGVLRSSFLNAIVYVCGIWMLEKYFGSVANGMSQIYLIMVAFCPIILQLLGIFTVLKSLKF